jgi:putative hydrolase of the HAD superfamily
MHIRDPFPVLLFDMNSTFAFGEDRFGDGEDFSLAYRALGGTTLSAARVNAVIRACFAHMHARYEDHARCDDFLTVADALRDVAPDLEPAAAEQLVAVFAEHEVGCIPDDHADYLRRLSREHVLGLVSNVWAPKDRFLREFERAGIESVFRVLVFSSDTRSVKPSAKLFRAALDALGALPADALFVGDSLERDVAPASRLGLRTAWVARDRTANLPASDAPDHRLGTILDLDRPLART